MDAKAADAWNTSGAAQYRAGNWADAVASLPKYRELRTGDASGPIPSSWPWPTDTAFQIDWSRYGFPGVTRSYPTFWAAAEEQADSRIFGGIHFRFDGAAGQQIGANVDGYVVGHFPTPRYNPGRGVTETAPAPPGEIGDTGAGGNSGLFDFDRSAVTREHRPHGSDDDIAPLLNLAARRPLSFEPVPLPVKG